MPPKNPTNKYGLWNVEVVGVATSRQKPKSIALIESNLRGVERWLEDRGLRPERHRLTLLPEVEYVDPVNDLHGSLGTGGIRQTKKKPGLTGHARKIPKTMNFTSPKNKRAVRSGYCSGSAKAYPRSMRGRKTMCTACLKMITVNRSDGLMRVHKP